MKTAMFILKMEDIILALIIMATMNQIGSQRLFAPVTRKDKEMRWIAYTPHPLSNDSGTDRYHNLPYLASHATRYLYPLEDKRMHAAGCRLCPRVYLPVCTRSNQTFLNVCWFRCRGGREHDVLYKGVCIFY